MIWLQNGYAGGIPSIGFAVLLFTSVAVLLFTSVGNLNFALVESDQVTMHVESDEVTMHSAQSLLLHGNVTSDFRSFGTEWIGNTPLLREILSEISLKYPETRNVIHNKSFCYEYEHSLVLSGGRSLPSGTPFGKVPSIYNSSETYRVRTAICDRTKYNVVVEYSMANVRNFETSGLFSPSLLSRIVYIPCPEYEYRLRHQERSMAPITTFEDINQPRRKEMTERLLNRGIHVVNSNKIHGRDEMMALYYSTAILINIHQTPYHHTLEEFRLLPALLRGVVVVCELSPHQRHPLQPVRGVELLRRPPVQSPEGDDTDEQLRRLIRQVLRPAVGAAPHAGEDAAGRPRRHREAHPAACSSGLAGSQATACKW